MQEKDIFFWKVRHKWIKRKCRFNLLDFHLSSLCYFFLSRLIDITGILLKILKMFQNHVTMLTEKQILLLSQECQPEVFGEINFFLFKEFSLFNLKLNSSIESLKDFSRVNFLVIVLDGLQFGNGTHCFNIQCIRK